MKTLFMKMNFIKANFIKESLFKEASLKDDVVKESVVKAAVAAVSTGLSLYFQALLLPLILLVVVMVLDYATGMVKAWLAREIHSRCGIVGIIKKVCYLLLVCCGVFVDFTIHATLSKIGISYNVPFAFGLLICIWLIINELISILENLGAIGVPMPRFLIKIIERLKVTVEKSAESAADVLSKGEDEEDTEGKSSTPPQQH